jgi:hypothetical protein
MKRKLEIDPSEMKLLETKITKQSAIRMQNYRSKRLSSLQSIPDTEIRRIAIELDTMKDNKEYVIIPDVINASVKLSTITLVGSSQAIAFGNATRPYKRWMQAIKNPEYLSNVLEAIKQVFPLCDNLVIKLLSSMAGDKEQDLHADFVPTENTGAIRDLKNFHYSAIISIQNNTQLIIGQRKEIVDIPIFSMLFFRGDMVHAGAGYSEKNSRIFISISSESFPESDGVFLHTYS